MSWNSRPATLTGTYALDFIQTNNCSISPNTLGAGASCTLTVNFTPSTLGGTKETAKIVKNDNANNIPQTVFLKGADSRRLIDSICLRFDEIAWIAVSFRPPSAVSDGVRVAHRKIVLN
jgi:hypothetical protein